MCRHLGLIKVLYLHLVTHHIMAHQGLVIQIHQGSGTQRHQGLEDHLAMGHLDQGSGKDHQEHHLYTLIQVRLAPSDVCVGCVGACATGAGCVLVTVRSCQSG